VTFGLKLESPVSNSIVGSQLRVLFSSGGLNGEQFGLKREFSVSNSFVGSPKRVLFSSGELNREHRIIVVTLYDRNMIHDQPWGALIG
jgi:hypothetical protein